DRHENTNSSTEPEVGLVEQGLVAGEGDPAAARRYILGAELAQLLGEDRLDAAPAGGEETHGPHRPPFRRLFWSHSCRAAAPGMMKRGRARRSRKSLMAEEETAGSEADTPGSQRARFGVWPTPPRPPAADLLRNRATDTLFARVAGLDVHLKSIRCAARCRQDSGRLLTQGRSVRDLD